MDDGLGDADFLDDVVVVTDVNARRGPPDVAAKGHCLADYLSAPAS